MNDDVIAAIKKAAVNHQIEAAVIAAFVMQESGGMTWTSRFESLWKYLVDPVEWAQHTGVSNQTERTEQSISWGLMQIMGSRARELGFKGYLPELCMPDMGLEYGCLDLISIAKIHKLSVEGAALTFSEPLASAYNAGSPIKKADGTWGNQSYVDGVRKYYCIMRGNI